MNQDIGIGMAGKAQGMRNLDPSQKKGPTFRETMGVKTLADPQNAHPFFSFIP
jgi:hypothetical protein